MKDFAYVADRIIGGAFAPFFSEELPPYLGRDSFSDPPSIAGSRPLPRR